MVNTSNRVDVVIADSPVLAEVLHDGPILEAVDVAPVPERRVIVLAPTKQAGQRYAESLGIEPAAIVTPRSPHASRGIMADEIVEAPGLIAEVVAGLMTDAAPSLATTEGA